jgi:hypothetical protein
MVDFGDGRRLRASIDLQRISFLDDVVHHRCDDVRRFGVDDGILVVCVQQHLIQALLHGVSADEIRSLLFDELFKSARRSRMICRSHDILQHRVAGQAFGGVSALSDAAFSQFQNLTTFISPRFIRLKLYIYSGLTNESDFMRSVQHRSSWKMTWRMYGTATSIATEFRGTR